MKIHFVDGEFKVFFDRDEQIQAIEFVEYLCDQYEEKGVDASQIRSLVYVAKTNLVIIQ